MTEMSKNSEFAQMQGAQKIAPRRIWVICKQTIFTQRGSWDEIWIFRDARRSVARDGRQPPAHATDHARHGDRRRCGSADDVHRQGAQYAIKQTISAMGSNLFVLLSGQVSSGGVRSGSGGAQTLTVNDAEAIAELPGVQAAAPIHPGNAQVVYGPNNWNTSILGTTPKLSGGTFLASGFRSCIRQLGRALRHARRADRQDRRTKTCSATKTRSARPSDIRQSPFIILGTLATKGQSMDGATRMTPSSSRSPRAASGIWQPVPGIGAHDHGTGTTQEAMPQWRNP